ncbi:hypothetical protein GGF46_001453 [Coemansia sp. RSA 552]|nr:hypothetical protein GGF46_001453 [Coemansia sp. RSA 552]
MSAGKGADSSIRSSALSDKNQVFFHDSAAKTLGCSHYQTKAKLLAPCCGLWVPCRFCHAEVCGHSMDRFSVQEMKCMLCKEEQPVGQECRQCHVVLGRYFCSTCRLLDDEPNKSIFHCDQCGICLRGARDDYFHCTGCGACVATDSGDKHACTERALHADCPVCGEQLFGSTSSIVQTRCRHLIHRHCLEQSIEYSYKCPLCAASLVDTRALFGAIDEYMRISSMPQEHQNATSLVFCCDCRQRSVAQYHFLYHKCRCCSSYNTSVISTDHSVPVTQ